MAGEEQYYSPIIQAMIANAQDARTRQQNENQAEQHKQELALRQKEADRASKHLDTLESQQQQQIDSENAVRAATQKHQLLTDKLSIANNIRAGVMNAPVAPPNQPGAVGVNQSGGQSGTVNILGQDFDPTQLSNPAQAEAQRIQGLVGQQKALLPGQIEAERAKQGITDESEAKKLKLQQDFQTSQKDLDRKNELFLHQMDNQSHAQITAGTNATTLAAAHLAHDIPTSQLQSGLFSLATGDRNFNSDNPYDRAVQTGAQAAGLRPVLPKEIDTLKQSQLIEPTLQKVQEFVNTLPSETQGGSGIKAAVKGFITRNSPIPTDTQNKLAQIKTGTLNVARDLEGLTGGRVTQQQMGIYADGLANPGITKEQGQALYDNIKDLAVNKENNAIMGGMGNSQKKMIYQKYGIKPAFLIGAPPTNKAGHKLDINTSIDMGQPVYSNGGQ